MLPGLTADRHSSTHRADNRDTEVIPLPAVSCRSKKDVGIIIDMLGKFIHQQLHLKEGHVVPSADMGNQAAGIIKHPALVQQRALERTLECIQRTVLSLCLAKAKQAP